MRVAPSSYYAARARPLSARSVRDEALTEVIRRVWEENYCVFGVRKMHAFLNTHALGVGHVARCTVERFGVVRKLLTVCLCGFCPGRLV